MNRSVIPVDRTNQTWLRLDWRAFLTSRACAGALAALSCFCLLGYVFYWAPYEYFLYNDMLGYWNRAMERLNGQTFRETQFMAWPPIYHIYLAEFFRICRWLGLVSLIRFETVLVMNIVVFAVSVYAVHRIAVRWFEQSGAWSMATTLFYGFGFPAWYFNAFLLSDNFSAPLLVIAVALVYCRESWRSLVAAAVLFAIAAAARPSIAPYGLAFVIPLLVRHRFRWEFFARAAVFSGVFFLLVFTAMAEVSRISSGKVKGLSANGGLDFFIANARHYRIDVSYEGWHNFVIVPALSWKPEQGSFYSNVPYYQQDHYFGLGWDHLRHDPARLIKNIEHIKHLFFADMLPSRYDAPGFKFFRPLWDMFKFTLFVSVLLYFWLWSRLSVQQKYLASLMMSLVGVTLVVSYIFTGEPRYTYSIMFVFYLLGFNALRLVLQQGRSATRILPPFAVLLMGLWLSSKLLAYWVDPPGEPHVEAVLLDATDSSRKAAAHLPSLYFPFSKKLPLHSEYGDMKLQRPGTLVFKTQMHVDQPIGRVGWEVFSNWPVKIRVDGKIVMEAAGADYFRAKTAITPLTPGIYLVEVEVPYQPGESGLAVNYVFFDEEQWMYRQKLGEDKSPVRFSLPESEDHDN